MKSIYSVTLWNGGWNDLFSPLIPDKRSLIELLLVKITKVSKQQFEKNRA